MQDIPPIPPASSSTHQPPLHFSFTSANLKHNYTAAILFPSTMRCQHTVFTPTISSFSTKFSFSYSNLHEVYYGQIRIHHYSITLWSRLYMYNFTELRIIPYTYTDSTSLSISLYAPDSNIFTLYGNKDLYSPCRSWLSSCSPLIPQVLF